MSTTAALITVEEFLKHVKVGVRLNDAFNPINGRYEFSTCEFPFRPTPEHKLWCANVAFVSAARERAIDPEGYLAGAPEICLDNGCLEFWVVDPKRKIVEVTRAEGTTKIYRTGASILLLPGNSDIAVDEIFQRRNDHEICIACQLPHCPAACGARGRHPE